ncbi:hypothetical protein [Natronoglomus mannanivorans]|uniref:Uncharacterized protein n=1 Tax=Natronoglomus mannanivorans TaxID=2979990 RepID=A0AAP2Z387_9EURY|nr:hypothetical protein [Halobacteria archaeon AArc-xg1-1]
MSTETDDATETGNSRVNDEDTSGEEAVDDLQASIEETIGAIDEDGEQIKKAIATIVIQDKADAEVVGTLHEEVGSLLRNVTHEHEAVGMFEVAMTLWTELRFIADAMDGGGTEDDDVEESNPSTGRTDGDDVESSAGGTDESSETLENEQGSLLPVGTDESEGPPADPAFH